MFNMKIFATFIAVLALFLAVQAFPYSSEESNENQNTYEVAQRENKLWRSQVPANWINKVTESTDAKPFLRALEQRLNNSNQLSSKPEVRETLEQLGLLKLYKCKSIDSDQEDITLDKGCKGRWLGQMMQYINNIESVNQDIPQLTVHSRNYGY